MSALTVVAFRGMPGSLFAVLTAVFFSLLCFAITAGETAELIEGRHSSTFLCEESNRGGVEKRPRAGLSSLVGKRQTDFDPQFYSLLPDHDNYRLLVVERYSCGFFLLVF